MRRIMLTFVFTLTLGASVDAQMPINAAGVAERIQPVLRQFAVETGAEVRLPDGGNAVVAPQPQPATATAPKREDILFVMREMEFAVEGRAPGADLILKAGQRYKLSFENHGQVRHEVLFGRGVTQGEDGLDYQEHLFRNVEVDVWGRTQIGGEKRIYGIKTFGLGELELDPGTRLSIFVTIPESARGSWEFGCFAPGHHESGMHVPVVIQ